MQFNLINDISEDIDTLCLSIGEYKNLDEILQEKCFDNISILKNNSQEIIKQLKFNNFKASEAKTCQLLLNNGDKLIKTIVYCLGNKFTYKHLRKFAIYCAKLSATNMAIVLPKFELAPKLLYQAFTESFILTKYKFDKYKTTKNESKKTDISQINFIDNNEISSIDFKKAIDQAFVIAKSHNMARDLINEPANVINPESFCEFAKTKAQEFNLEIEIFDREKLQQNGMNLILGVGQGSKTEPRMLVLKYIVNKDSHIKYGIAGKGITFDSGGLSLKSAQGMEYMKYDMSGSAITLALMTIIAQVKPDFNVIAVMPLAENMPDNNSIRPGDVIKSANGLTVEINNTDAEGRLVLADAIHFLTTQNVEQIIDIATLTGGVVQALGRAACAVLTNKDELLGTLKKASDISCEKFWQLPLFEEYKDSLKSEIADIKNAGSRGEAATSCAATFLQEFIKDCDWLHFDIANVGWSDSAKNEFQPGPTAFGLRLLAYYILDNYFN